MASESRRPHGRRLGAVLKLILSLLQFATLVLILGALRDIEGTLGPMTFKVECHPDNEIDRMVCFIMPIDDLIYTDVRQRPGDNA